MGGWWWSEDKEGTYERGYMCEYVTSSKLRHDRSDDVSNVHVVSSMLTADRLQNLHVIRDGYFQHEDQERI